MVSKKLFTDYLILPIGKPGCGKGTAMKSLAQTLSIEHVSTGDLIRALPKEDPRRIMSEAGKLIPDEEVSRIALPYVEMRKTLVLDGFPRTIAQYDVMLDHLGRTAQKKLDDIIFIGIDCPPKVALMRLENRAREENRADDQREKLEIRLSEYENNTLPLWLRLSTRVPESGNRRFADLEGSYEISQLKRGGYFVKLDGARAKEGVYMAALKAFTLINNLTRPISEVLAVPRRSKVQA